jgi:hypothetical protein
MAKFFEALGHRVIRTPSTYWYDVFRRFYLGFPHHRVLALPDAELSQVFRSLPAGVRYFAPPSAPGRASYALVIRDRGYDLDRLSANTRSKVRRGLARCQVERLTPASVRAHGRVINDDTLRRTRMRDRYPWDVYWDAAEQSADCVEVWGATIDGVLAAYLVAVRADRCCEILIARSHADWLKYYPNNALLFTVVRDMLARPDVDEVFFGVESLDDAAEGTELFKLSMGFAKSPIRQRIVLHPLLRPALRSTLVVRGLAALSQRRPDNELLRKLHGLAVFSAPTPEPVSAPPVAH